MVYEIMINAFQGPFDLLFHLIEKNQLDINDIPIAHITEQYLEYLNKMEKMDLEITSEFLVMAARLLAIKAKLLLPKPAQEVSLEQEEEADPRGELVSQLLEYKMYKEIALYFKDRAQSSGKIFSREIDQEEMMEQFGGKNQLKNLSLTGLARTFAKVLAGLSRHDKIIEIEIDEISIENKMAEITKKLFLQPKGLWFSQLVSKGKTVKELIATFWALLELTKLQQVFLEQATTFGDILIVRNNGKYLAKEE